MTEILFSAAYAILSAGFSWSLYSYGRVEPALAGLCGAFLFVAMQQIHSVLTRLRYAHGFEKDLQALRSENGVIRNALDETRKTMDEVTEALTKRTVTQEKKMVGELQIIEGLIREFAASVAKKSEVYLPTNEEREESPAASAGPSYAQGLTDPLMLELIRRSLEENRVDLYLQPVVSLPQRKVRFYEALSRLRSEDGAVIMPAQYIKVAAPAGLMSVVDNLLLFRCVQIVRRLTQKTKDIAVFCNISGHTLMDAEFFPQFLDFMHHHKDLASQIVFEFGADSVLNAGDSGEANLKYLSGLGFRLSLDQVSTLDLDFAKLKRLGFQFVKVHARTLISGMDTAKAAVAAEDFKDLLTRNGINLIAERIEEEKSVVQLLEFNVDFGQGYLFGEPRPIREVGEIHDPRVKEVLPMPGSLPAGLIRRLAS